MARTIILSVSTFAIIGVCFAIYQVSVGNIEQDENTFPVEAHGPFLRGETATGSGGEPLKLRDVEISPGEKPRITIYNASLEAKVKWRADFWEPRDENTMYMQKLDIEYLMSGGEVAYLKADEAEIIMQKSGRSNFIPRRGWLKGHILVVIDRSTKEWRDANPDQRLPEQRPEDVIRIWFDELEFDLELASLNTEGDFRVQSADVDIEATGLLVHWNEVDNRVEKLVITKGKRMELKRGGSAVAFAMPGTGQEEVIEATDAAPSTTAMASASVEIPAVAAPASEPKGVAQDAAEKGSAARANGPASVASNRPVTVETDAGATANAAAEGAAGPHAMAMEPAITLADDQEEEEEKPITTYAIDIDGNINVEQIQGVKVIGQLVGARQLRILRDMTAAVMSETRTLPNKKDQEAAEAAKRAEGVTEEEAVEEPVDDTRLVLHWDGPLLLRPDFGIPKDEFTGRRFQIEATGAPVRLETEQGNAVCEVLTFHDETKKVWLRGSGDFPIDVVSDKTRKLHARDLVHFDRSTGKARLEGPGFLQDSRGGPASLTGPAEGVSMEQIEAGEEQPVEIRWSNHIDLQFNQETRVVYDPELKAEVTKRRTYIESAELDGGVKIDQSDQLLSAEHVTLAFGKPQKDSGLGDNIKSLQATGNVILEDDRDRITCEDRLDVEMIVSPDGKNVPHIAKAYGNVLAVQGDRHIAASDRMEVKMGQFPKPPIPWDLATAKAYARSKGIDPENVDWEVQQKKWEQKQAKRTEVGIAEMHGVGIVTAIDPSQNLDLRCVELTCRFSQGEQIEHAVIVGPRDGLAYVGVNDFIIEGQTVTVNNATQSVDVPGGGRLRFWARQDLDGRPTAEPVPAVVNWSSNMQLKGEENYCEFLGEVLALTPTNQFNGERLRIDFFDVPREAGAKINEGDQWIVGSFVKATKRRPTGGLNQPTFSKKPRYLTATGEATVVTSSFDEGTQGGSGTYVDQFAQTVIAAIHRVKGQLTPSAKDHLGAPEIPDASSRGRLLSRMRIAGPVLSVDFRKETLNVDGKGNLLIEEYRMSGGRTTRAKTTSSDPVLGNLSEGPSQTFIKWGNSMSFFSERNLAVFDQLVHMAHRGGTEMALSDKLATAFKVDVESLRRLKGRSASLNCDNLLVEFASAPGRSAGSLLTDRGGATELNQFRATGSAHLEEGSKSIIGEEVVYSRQSNIVTILGSEKIEGRVFEMAENKRLLRSVRGKKLRWYRDDNRIEIEEGTFLSRGG